MTNATMNNEISQELLTFANHLNEMQSRYTAQIMNGEIECDDYAIAYDKLNELETIKKQIECMGLSF